MSIQKTPRMIVEEMGKFKNPAHNWSEIHEWLYDLANYIDLTTSKKSKVINPTLGLNTNKFIKEYAESYELRYGVSPVIFAREAGIARRLVRELGLERAVDLIKAYLEIGSDPWICAKKHNLATFEQNINAVSIYAKTKKYTTLQEFQQREKNMLKEKK